MSPAACLSARKPERLTRRAEFLAAARLGRKAPVHGLVLQALERADDAPARLGFTVTKKVGNAVVRNRTKRRLRACARAVLAEAPLTGVDLVLIGRDATRSRSFALLLDDLRRALAKAGVQPAASIDKAGVQPAASIGKAGVQPAASIGKAGVQPRLPAPDAATPPVSPDAASVGEGGMPGATSPKAPARGAAS